jgi:cytochrome c-type biogenesis protein CcmH/NrfF
VKVGGRERGRFSRGRSRAVDWSGAPVLLAATLILAATMGSPDEATASWAEGVPAATVQDAVPPFQTVVPDPAQFEANAPTDDPHLEADVRKLARQLRCPTCQALSIADSPSELAREMEGVIRMRLQEGMTPEEVRASFVDAYGEWVLLSPDPSGFNLLVYLLPLAALLLGTGIVVAGIRKWLGEGTEGALSEGEAPPAP